MSKKIDMTGFKCGRLTVIKEDTSNTSKSAKWICQCECGNIVSVSGSNLRKGKTKSCGCLNKEKENLNGQIFGMLAVLNRIEDSSKVLCKCECGNTTEVYPTNLKRGLTKSCGCLHNKIVSKRLLNDLTGKTFERLTVVERAENLNRDTAWKCRCECGNEIIVRASCLTSGITKSCGCYRAQVSSERFSLKLEGQRFGKLTVLNRDGTLVGSDGSKYSYWRCKCDCGNETTVKGYDLKIGKVQSCGCLISKAEQEIRKILTNKNVGFETQYMFQDLKSDKGWSLRFDFAILADDNQLLALIEYQGRQHYEPVDFSGKGYNNAVRELHDLQYRDYLKKEYCKAKNIPLFEITFQQNVNDRMACILSEIESYGNPVPSSN